MAKEFNPLAFRMKFKAALTVLAFLAGMAFLFMVCFYTKVNKEFAGPTLGFISGTLLTLVFTYYFGNSDDKPEPEKPVPDLQQINEEDV